MSQVMQHAPSKKDAYIKMVLVMKDKNRCRCCDYTKNQLNIVTNYMDYGTGQIPI